MIRKLMVISLLLLILGGIFSVATWVNNSLIFKNLAITCFLLSLGIFCIHFLFDKKGEIYLPFLTPTIAFMFSSIIAVWIRPFFPLVTNIIDACIIVFVIISVVATFIYKIVIE